jgi:cyclopropane fatty-acyl-phospholipid synthase-like methyltransferase
MIFSLQKSYQKIKDFTSQNIDLQQGAKVLDIGCGKRGNFWNFDPKTYIGVDNDIKIISSLKQRRDGNYMFLDVCKALDFEDKSFDLVVSVSLFHHLSDRQAQGLCLEISRVLKPEGLAIIADGVFPGERSNVLGFLIRYFDRGKYVRNAKGLKKIFERNFSVQAERVFTDSIYAYSVLNLKVKGE